MYHWILLVINLWLVFHTQTKPIGGLSNSKQSNYKLVSEIKTIDSIQEASKIFSEATSTSLVVFDIGETLVVQKNNLLRIIRNYRIFNHNDVHLMNCIISKFMKRNRNARINILSNMLINSRVYLVEPNIKFFINNLQTKNIKVIAHCSSKGTDFGTIQNFKEWRYNLLKDLDLDFTKSFPDIELLTLGIKNDPEFSALFYKGLLFGGKPKAKALGVFLDRIKYKPTEVIYFDDCENFVEQYASEMKKRNIPFRGFVYKAAVRQKPQLNTKIVDTQVQYMKKNRYIDDIRASKIIRSKK